MRTNGSQSGHIQVDKQTIETALDDEGGSRRQQQQDVDLNEENDKKKATASSSVLLLRNGNGGTGLQQQSSPDLLDILDNFLITTSNPDETAASNAINQVSHTQMDNSTNISARLALSSTLNKSTDLSGLLCNGVRLKKARACKHKQLNCGGK